MKAIILSSGIGKRLRPLTNKIPKSLIKLNGKTIIELQIDNLLKNDIKNIIVTTGPYENIMINHLKERYEDINFIFVNNPKYDSTNYIYSLWLTKDYIDDDILLLHGDLLFDEKLIKKLIEKKGNYVLVNKDAKLPKKDFKAEIKDKKVIKIGIEFFGKNCFLSMPIYKFSNKDFLVWMNEIDKEIKKGNVNIYAENAFNKISDKLTIEPVYFNKEICMEIDDIKDLEKARELFLK